MTTEDGTGIVHIAPAFGEDELATARVHGLDAPQPGGSGRTVSETVGAVGRARLVKEADSDLVADLTRRGAYAAPEVHRHSYPFCWRCGTPLLYYAKPTWYIRTTAVRDS